MDGCASDATGVLPAQLRRGTREGWCRTDDDRGGADGGGGPDADRAGRVRVDAAAEPAGAALRAARSERHDERHLLPRRAPAARGVVPRAPRLVPSPAYTRQVLPCSSHARAAHPCSAAHQPAFPGARVRTDRSPTRDGPPEPHQTERARMRQLQVRYSSAREARP